jgi:hypothetical protein
MKRTRMTNAEVITTRYNRAVAGVANEVLFRFKIKEMITQSRKEHEV